MSSTKKSAKYKKNNEGNKLQKLNDFEGIMEFAPGSIYWKDLNGIYLGCNDFMVKIVGLKSKSDIIGKTDLELWPKQAAIIRYNDEQVIKTGKSLEIEENVLLDGKERYFVAAKMPLKNKQGTIIGVIGNSLEITELKNIQETLVKQRNKFEKKSHEASQYLESIMAVVPGSIYWKDKNATYLGCNDFLVKVLGKKSKSDIIGKTDLELWPDQAASLKYNDEQVMKTGRAIQAEETVFLHGELRYFTAVKMPLKDEYGNVIGIIGNSIDITELKNAQKALYEQIKKTAEAYRSKTEFLSTVTHEIRNPVGNVSTYSHFLKEDLKKLKAFFYREIVSGLDLRKKDKTLAEYDKLFNKIVENVDTVGAETNKALEYLKSVGELHRLQHEGIKPNYMSVTIQELNEGVIEDTAQYNTENVEVITSIDPKVPEIVKIDYFNVSDALRVVLSNAIRFSNAKGVVKFDVGADKKQLKLTVQNFGHAISQEQIHALLGGKKDKKSELKTAIYRKPSLRLTQAKMQLEASGGKLDIKSVGNSTTVTLFVPYSLEIESVYNQKEKGSRVASVVLKRNVLVVEDDLNFQKTEKRIIEELGHKCTFASTGAEALNLLSKNTYDLVLLDITLPDMTGTEVLKKVRKGKKTLPIVVITSHSHKKDTDFFEGLGATHVLIKPLSRADFKDCLEFDFSTDEDDD